MLHLRLYVWKAIAKLTHATAEKNKPNVKDLSFSIKQFIAA